MRPLPVEPLAGMPPFLLGLAVIRGVPTPVVHAGILLGAHGVIRFDQDPGWRGDRPDRGAADLTPPGRFLSIKVGARRVALAVDAILDVIDVAGRTEGALPPLLHRASSELIAAIGTLDAGLLLVLDGARLIPDALWTELEAAR